MQPNKVINWNINLVQNRRQLLNIYSTCWVGQQTKVNLAERVNITEVYSSKNWRLAKNDKTILNYKMFFVFFLCEHLVFKPCSSSSTRSASPVSTGSAAYTGKSYFINCRVIQMPMFYKQLCDHFLMFKIFPESSMTEQSDSMEPNSSNDNNIGLSDITSMDQSEAIIGVEQPGVGVAEAALQDGKKLSEYTK